MEAGDRVSALGGAGAFRLWRAAVHFLSAGVVDSRGGGQFDFSLDMGSQRLRLDCAGRRGRIHVHVGPPVA